VNVVRWLRSLLGHRRLEQDMQEEMRQHLELATQRLMARGLSPEDARRAALREFGNVHYLQESSRDVRGTRWLGTLSPDAKLALRMLVKNPLLSVVGGLGMAVAVCIAIGFFTWMTFYYSHPPIEEGDRVVTVEYISGDASETTLSDYLAWRGRVTSVEDLAAYTRRTMVVEGVGGDVFSTSVVTMTASGFRLARVPALLGRILLDSDELDGAAPVVVIGFREWQQLFGADPDVIGAEVTLDGTVHTIVGVMPDGFRLPGNDGLWSALRTDLPTDGAAYEQSAWIFARLAAGVDGAAAEAELTAVGDRLAVEDTRDRPRSRLVVLPFIRHILDVQQYPPWMIWLAQLFAGLILALVAVNVAVLVYARTALRTGEIALRTALGATRARIVSQLFLEAFALALAAAALGLVMAEIGFRQMVSLVSVQERLPYWLFDDLPRSAVLYAFALAVLAAFIVGGIPALQATGRQIQSTLRQLGGGTGLRLGKTWTLLICVQVAVAVGVLPVVLGIVWSSGPPPTVNFPASEMLSFRTQPPAASQQPGLAYGDRQAELLRRVEELPGVVGVTYGSSVPMRGSVVRVEAESRAGPLDGMAPVARVHRVDPSYFRVLGVPLLAGRAFSAADAEGGAVAAIVNRSFVDRFLGGGNALGHRFRRSTDAQQEIPADAPWFEIVGVVDDLLIQGPGAVRSAIFFPSALGPETLTLVARTRGVEPADLSARIRELAAEVGLGRGVNVAPLDTHYRSDGDGGRLLAVMVAIITLSVLLLSAAGISAMMSFAVSRRQREIGVRTALGATRRQLIASIFERSTIQLAGGVLVGSSIAALLDRIAGGELLGGQPLQLLGLVAAIMLATGLVATWTPLRRALRLEATAALQGD
jgi:predicted permease